MKNILNSVVAKVCLLLLVAGVVSMNARAQGDADPAINVGIEGSSTISVGQTTLIKLQISNYSSGITDIPAQSLDVTLSVGDGTTTTIVGIDPSSSPNWTQFSLTNGTIHIRNMNGPLENWVDDIVYILVKGTKTGIASVNSAIGYIAIPNINPITGLPQALPGNVLTGNDNGSAGKLTITAPLPLKLLSFNASKQTAEKNNTVLLTWTVAEQVNTGSFEVERTIDGKNYSKIGTVAAAGNYAGKQTYSFTDANAATGINYYRLKMVDIDGKFTYSPVKTVLFDGKATENVFLSPNPTRGEFHVKGLTATAIVRVLDINGKVLQTYNGVNAYTTLNIAQLPSAVYLVQVIEDGKFGGTFKVVKE